MVGDLVGAAGNMIYGPRFIYVWPHQLRGGVSTLCELAKLFDIPMDAQDFSKPVMLVIHDLSQQDKLVLLDLLKEYHVK